MRPDNRDLPLGFHWSTIDYERIHALGVPHHRDRDRNRARNSILTEAVLAHEEGRWVSYSRRQGFYTDLRRYYGTAYTYATIMAAIDELLSLGLIKEERSQKGQRGRQSRFRATPRLVEGLAEALFEYELHGLIRLKDDAGNLIGFRDTRDIIRMQREVEHVNRFLATIDVQFDAPDVVRTRNHVIIGEVSYRLTERKPGLIGIPEGVAHRTYVLCNRLHGACLLQHGRLPMFLLDIPGKTVKHAGNRLEPDPRQRKAPFNIGLHGDPLFWLVLAGNR